MCRALFLTELITCTWYVRSRFSLVRQIWMSGSVRSLRSQMLSPVDPYINCYAAFETESLYSLVLFYIFFLCMDVSRSMAPRPSTKI